MNTCIVCNSYNDSLELVVSSSLVSEKHITLSRKPKEKRNGLKFQNFLFILYILMWRNERPSEIWFLTKYGN